MVPVIIRVSELIFPVIETTLILPVADNAPALVTVPLIMSDVEVGKPKVTERVMFRVPVTE